MSRDVPKNYPRTVESKNSYLRIRAPEHLDVALEGLIRKVLKEQPKMDDIYAFAADYFDMLLKIRTKAGLRKLSTQDICPNHNEEDAHEMIKLASTFTKRPKESKPKSKTYQALSLRDRNKYKKHTEKQKEQEVNLGNENNELTTLVARIQESRKEAEMEPENADEISGTAEETESDYSVNIPTKETDRIIVKATEVIFEENANEIESPRAVLETVENVGNIDEIRDKIREVESEIKQLDKKEIQIASEEINKEKDAENVTEEKNSTNEKGPHDKSHFQRETNVEHAEQVNINNNEKQEVVGKKESAEILDEQNGYNDERIKETNLNTEGKEETKKRNGEPKWVAKNTEEKEVEQITQNDEKRMESGYEKIGNEEAEKNQTPKHTKEEMSALEDAEKIKSVTETPEEKQQILAAAEDLQEHERENDTEKNSIVSMEAEEAVLSAKDDQQTDGNENNLHSDIEESKILKGESNNDNSAAITEEAENEENIEVEGEVEAKAEEPEQLEVIKNDIQKQVQHTTQNIENNAEETTVTFSKLEEEEAHDERSDNKGEEEGKPSEVITAQVQSADSTTEKEIEMFGEGLLKNEKLESGELIESEKHAEIVENSEIVKQEISEAEPVVEEDVKSGENDSTPLIPDINSDYKESEGKQTEETEKNEIEKVSESSDINLQKDAILENAAVGCPVETSLQKVTIEENSKIIEEQTTADEERLLGTEGAKQEATDINVVQEFLDHEQEYSSHDKQITNEVKSRADIIESQLKSEAVTDSATSKISFPAEALQNEENLLALENEKIYENTDWEGDDQPKDVSTTSDEIEFELSPTKYPDDPTSTTGENASTEPVIVVNEDSTEQKMASVEEYVDESKKALLEVPMPVLKEYPRKKISECESDESHRTKRSVDEKTSVDEPGEESIIDCGNMGNEIIQRGQVQKVELVEGEEDILQVHLTTTVETEQHEGGNVHLEMSSRIEPEIEVLVETKLESPIPENQDKLRIVRAAVVIQNGFRRFKNRRNAGEGNKPDNELTSTLEVDSTDKVLQSVCSSHDDSSSGTGTHKVNKDLNGKTLSTRATRNLLETHSLDPIRKISPLKTRSLSNVRYGVADFEMWNKLVKELEEAATKIQSNYRRYKTRKKLMRGNAIQSMTTTSEDSTSAVEAAGITQRHTGEFHDSIVLALSPK